MTRGEWHHRAACRGVDDCSPPAEEVFHPTSAHPAAYREALGYCAVCPVTAECLDTAMRVEARGESARWGIWGGLTPKQRADLAAAERKAAAGRGVPPARDAWTDLALAPARARLVAT